MGGSFASSHFLYEERTFAANKFKPKFSFNPRSKDATIETCLSFLEMRLLDIEIPFKGYNNL